MSNLRPCSGIQERLTAQKKGWHPQQAFGEDHDCLKFWTIRGRDWDWASERDAENINICRKLRSLRSLSTAVLLRPFSRRTQPGHVCQWQSILFVNIAVDCEKAEQSMYNDQLLYVPISIVFTWYHASCKHYCRHEIEPAPRVCNGDDGWV